MRRALKISAWSVAGLALLALLLFGTVFIAGNTDTGRAMIERLTYRLTDGQVKLSGLVGSFPRRLTLGSFELRDHRGVWLTAERIALRWVPLALLERRVQVDSLQVASVDMERLPQSSTTKRSSAPVSIPQIDVGTLSVDVLKLGPELAGMPASLVVRGSAHLRTLEDMSIDVTAHRIGDADDAGNTPGAGDTHGAVNGADAVNAPGAVNANNTGSAVYGDYELHLRFDPKRMDAALTLHEPASGPLEHLLHVPGLGALAATATLRGPRAAERLDLSVDAGPLHGRAQGSLNLSDLSADLDFTLQSPAMNPRPDLKWQRAELHGRWHGSIKTPTADGHLEVVQLRVPGGVERAKLNADVTANSGNATLNAVLGGLKLPGLKPQLLQDAPVKVTASMHLDEITRPLDLQASHRLFALGAHVDTASMGAGKYNATAELHLLNLTPLAALAGQKLQGSALIKAQLRGEPAASHVMLQASAALNGGTEFWSGAVGNRATLQLAGTVTDKAIICLLYTSDAADDL